MRVTGLTTTTALTLTLASAAWAGGLTEPQPEPVIAPMVEVAPAPYDWSGFYAGLSAGKTSGNFDYIFGPGETEAADLDGRSFGGYAGYNWQRGSWVYGLELALQDVDAEIEYLGVAYPEEHFNYIHDLKARIGYANDNMLFYAFGGYSMGDYEIDGEGSWDANGPNMGLGVEMAFRENWLVGLEYIRRSLDGDFGPQEPGISFDSDVDTVQLRVGYKF